MEALPHLALRNLVRFLCPEDIVRLGRTCKRMYSVMPRVVLAKEKWLGEDSHIHEYYGERVSSEPYFDTPELSSTVKSLCLSVTWRDQGWGNRKGCFYLYLMRPVANGKPIQIAVHGNCLGSQSTTRNPQRLRFIAILSLLKPSREIFTGSCEELVAVKVMN